MPSLNDNFQQFIGHIRESGSLRAAQSDPFYYFVYLPEETFAVRRYIPIWAAQLRDLELNVVRISFSDILWEMIDASQRWDEWLEIENDADQEEVNEAIRSVLNSGEGLIGKIAKFVSNTVPRTVVFLTETEMIHPYFRVRILESALHDRVKVPTIVFYPGRRSGQFGLHFLDLYPVDGNYRATLIGGLP